MAPGDRRTRRAPERPPPFRPTGQDDLAPAGAAAKLRANLDALATLRRCQEEDRWADPGEQAVLARWLGWGAIPHIFDDKEDRLAAERAELRRLLRTEAGWAQARRTTLNAHYTSAAVVQAMWGAAAALGVTGPVRVLGGAVSPASLRPWPGSIRRRRASP